MKKYGRCDEIRNIYLELAMMFLSFVIILLIGYFFRIKDINNTFINILYLVLIIIFFIISIPCLILGIYIYFQPKTILEINEENKKLFIYYHKNQRQIDISSIENVKIKQGIYLFNHLMSSTIILELYNQTKPFKIKFAYPPLMIKNEILKLKENF